MARLVGKPHGPNDAMVQSRGAERRIIWRERTPRVIGARADREASFALVSFAFVFAVVRHMRR
jgi:hypothetical protein